MQFTTIVALATVAVANAAALPEVHESAPLEARAHGGPLEVSAWTGAHGGNQCQGDNTSGSHTVNTGTRYCLSFAGGANTFQIQGQADGGCNIAGVNFFTEAGCPNGETTLIKKYKPGHSAPQCYPIPGDRGHFKSAYISCQNK